VGGFNQIQKVGKKEDPPDFNWERRIAKCLLVLVVLMYFGPNIIAGPDCFAQWEVAHYIMAFPLYLYFILKKTHGWS